MTAARHRVWADVDLAALRRNLARVVACVEDSPSARRQPGAPCVMAVVKADAYGHGAVPVARALAGQPGLWGFGVGDSNEALELCAAGIREPILMLGTIIEDEVPAVVSHDVRVCIHSMDRIRSLEREAERQGRRPRVHLMVDTGMGRLGAHPPRAVELGRAVAASPWLEFEGLASHSSPTRPGHPFAQMQVERLATVVAALEADGIRPSLIHMANTAAMIGRTGLEFDLVRPGIALYGVAGPDLRRSHPELDFEPVLSLRTQVVYLKDVPADTPIGYNGTYVTEAPTRIATLPVGYDDGLSYRLSNCGQALVRGRLAPIVGSVSMDYTMLDVGAIPDVQVGDTVTFIGRDGSEEITLSDVASLVGTIPYEIVCSIGKRVRHVYRRADAAVETRGDEG